MSTEAGERTVSQRLHTRQTATSTQLWGCMADDAMIAGYQFFEAGTINGIGTLAVGRELLPDVADDDQFRYIWRVTSSTSVVLDNPADGVQETWTDLAFASDDRLVVNSSSRGRLFCSLGTEELQSSAADFLKGLRTSSSSGTLPGPGSQTATSSGDQLCFDLYREAGAVPGERNCRAVAATVRSLRDYQCTFRGEFERLSFAYCGLPRYDESGEEGDRDDERCENSQGFPYKGAADFTFGPASEFMRGPIQNYNIVNALNTGTNLTIAVVEARESGDSSQVFAQIRLIVLSLIPTSEDLDRAFALFSDFSDVGSGNSADPCL